MNRAFFLSLLALCALTGCALQRRRAGRLAHFAGYKFTGSAPARECWAQDDWKACAYLSRKQTDPTGLVYFMHFATGDERGFEGIGLARAFFAEFEKRKIPAPTVVSVSFGTHWLLTGAPGGRQVVPLGKFSGEVMPAVEKKLGAPRRRAVWGMSMGGYNAAQLVFSRPGDFDAAVFSCPAFHRVDPMQADNEAAALAKRSLAPPSVVLDGMALFFHRLGGPKVWAEENPLAHIERGVAPPPILIQANRDDEYGFFEGAQAVAEALTQTGRQVEYSPVPGGHCVVDAREVARYLGARP